MLTGGKVRQIGRHMPRRPISREDRMKLCALAGSAVTRPSFLPAGDSCMCVVSMVMDGGLDWLRRYDRPYPVYVPFAVPGPPPQQLPPEWVEWFNEQLRKAKKYDEQTGQPDCENEGKKKSLQEIADRLGIKIDFPE